MINKYFAAALILTSFTLTAQAEDRREGLQVATVLSLFQKPIPSGSAPIPIQEEYEYVYLGCMHSTDECHHQAEASGYQHWTVRHDYGPCHHPPHDHACWGYND